MFKSDKETPFSNYNKKEDIKMPYNREDNPWNCANMEFHAMIRLASWSQCQALFWRAKYFFAFF